MKLKEFVKKRFFEKHLQQNVRLVKEFNFLDQYVEDIFPDQHIINSVVEYLSPKDKNYNFNYNVSFLPFHTNDDEWLASYTERAVSQLCSLKEDEKQDKEILPFCSLEPRNLLYSPFYEATPVNRQSIMKYIKFSPKFAEKRDAYEQKVTLAYINNLMHDDKYNFYLSAEEKTKCMNNVNCDKKFRNHVVDAMSSLGMGEKNIEASLEINAKVWRKAMMCRAFYNEKSIFSQQQLRALKKGNSELYKDLMDKENQYLRVWIRLREFEYYQENAKVIDSLGINSNKKLNAEQFVELNSKKKQLESEYELIKIRVLHALEDMMHGKHKGLGL